MSNQQTPAAPAQPTNSKPAELKKLFAGFSAPKDTW